MQCAAGHQRMDAQWKHQSGVDLTDDARVECIVWCNSICSRISNTVSISDRNLYSHWSSLRHRGRLFASAGRGPDFLSRGSATTANMSPYHYLKHTDAIPRMKVRLIDRLSPHPDLKIGDNTTDLISSRFSWCCQVHSVQLSTQPCRMQYKDTEVNWL